MKNPGVEYSWRTKTMSEKSFESDRRLFRQLRLVMTRAERLWLLDVEGDYENYRMRLRALARDYKIPGPDDNA